MNMVFDILLILLCCICTYTDIKTRKIKNKIIFPFMLIFLIFNIYIGKGFLFSIEGIFIGGLIPLILSLGQGLGGGDIKLFATMGALKGYKFTGTTFVWSLIFAILLSIFFNRKNFIKGIKNTYNMLKILVITREIPKIDANYSAQTIPYSINILLALIFNLILIFYTGGDYICHLLNI